MFKAKSDRSEQTELMVLVTPRLVRPLDPDEVPALPTRPGVFLPPPGAPGEAGAEQGVEGPVLQGRPDAKNNRRK